MKKGKLVYTMRSQIKKMSKARLISKIMMDATQSQKNKMLRLVLKRVTKAMLVRLYFMIMKNNLPKLKLTTKKHNLRLTSRKAYTKIRRTKRTKKAKRTKKRKVGTRFKAKNGRMMKVVKGGKVQFI